MDSKWEAVRNGRGVAHVEPDIPVVHMTDVSTWPWQWLLATAFAVLWTMRWAQVRFVEWRARVLRRETRRRYGIPDTDDRPFHIAYNAAAAARRQRELDEIQRKREQENESRSQYPDPASAPPPSAVEGALRRRQLSQQTQQTVVHRPVHFNSQPILDTRAPYGAQRRPNAQHTPSYPSRYQQQYQQQQPQPQEEDWAQRYNPNPPPVQREQAPRIVSSRKGVARLDFGSNFVERRRHVLGGVPFPIEPPANRKGKRHQSDDEEEHASGAGYRKRARKHDGLSDDHDAEMGDAEDEGDSTDAMDTDAAPAQNGTRVSLKRNRSQAASVVGAEDEQPRSRKLRRKGTDKGSAPVSKTARGTKRDRHLEEDEDEELPARNKRGRSESSTPSSEDEEMAEEAQEVEEPEVEVEPSCGGRKIGEAWTEGDVQFKVGPDGQRLRLAHLRQMRTRPIKAKDFATNKTPLQVPVVVEHWLNDAEFERAKQQKELAWGYDTDEEGSIPEVPAEDQSAKQLARVPTELASSGPRTSSGGKMLLWDTPSRSARTTPGSTPGPSPSSAAGALANPFSRSNGTTPASSGTGIRGKRVATGGTDERSLRPEQLRYSRSFSKWEKQEAEAEALAALRKKEKEKEEEEKRKNAPPPAPAASFPSAAPSTGASSNPLLFKAPDAAKPADAGKPASTATTEPPKLSFPMSTPLPKPAAPGVDAASTASKTVSFGPLPGSTPSTGTDATKTPAGTSTSSGFSLPPNPLLSGTSPAAPKPATAPLAFQMPTTMPATTPSFNFPPSDKKEDKKETDAAKPAAGGDAPKSFSFGPLPGSAPTPAAGTDNAGAARSPFSFPSASGGSSTSATAASTGSGDANKSLFAPSTGGAKSPFNFPTSSSTPGTSTSGDAAKPGFSMFGPSASSGSASNAFGPPSTDATKSGSGFNFAAPSATPAAATAMGTEAPKSMFSFPGATSTAATPTASSEAPKPTFSFPSSTPASAAPNPGLTFANPTPPAGAAPASGTSSFFATPPAGSTPAVAASNPFAPAAGGSAPATSAAPTLNALGRPMKGLRGAKSPGPSAALTPGASAAPAAGAPSAFNFGTTTTPASTSTGTAASPFGSFTAAGASSGAPAAPGSGFNLFGNATGAGTGSGTPASSNFMFGASSAAPASGATTGGAPPSLFGAPSTTNPLFGGAAAPGTPGAPQPQSSTPFGTPSTSGTFSFGGQK